MSKSIALSGWVVAVLIIIVWSIREVSSPIRQEMNFGWVKSDSVSTIRVLLPSYQVVRISVDSNSRLRSIRNDVSQSTQVINFYPNGHIRSKYRVLRDSSIDGRAYSFNEENGWLQGDYWYDNGVRTGSALTYHPGTDRIRSILLYDENGKLKYRKTFDIEGNVVSEEGTKY